MTRVSVVIPVKNRRDLLAETLDALEAQTFTSFEVIVVDDGSTDGSGDEARRRVIHGRPVIVVDGGGNGAVQARIAGVAASGGEILAFTDSDCVPGPKWLEAAMRAFDDGADLVNGDTRPARPMLPLERSMWSGEEGLYPTCNVLYRRHAYDAAGGFDASVADRWGFRPDRRTRGDGFGEDTVLAWRVIRQGGRAVHVPDAYVAHAVFPAQPAELLSRQFRVAGFPAMIRDVPELRETLLVGGRQLGRNRLPVYALAIAMLTRRWPFVAAALAWWAGLRLQELRRFPIPWRRRLVVLPVEMGIDAITTGSLVAGSVRTRNVVL